MPLILQFGSWLAPCLPSVYHGMTTRASSLLQLHILSDVASTARRQAMPCIAAAYAIISVVMVLTGTIGARLHIAFPVLNRSSFGFWFSYFTVFSRVLLSMFWFGIQVMIMSVHFMTRVLMHAFRHTMGRNAYIRCIESYSINLWPH